MPDMFIMPSLDPIAIQLGPLIIRWYALSYIGGIVLGWIYARRLVATHTLWAKPPGVPKQVDDLIVWVTLGLILGGRLGHVLIYEPAYYASHPLEVFQIWRGGMAFHGGLLGAILAIVLFAQRHNIQVLSYLDMAACVTPIGLFFGRIANFVNAEVWGRASDVPWAVVFCNERIADAHGGICPAGLMPRHPSQLYEAALEGLVLFAVLWILTRRGGLKRPGLASGVFCLGYGLMRSFVELFREPDGYVLGFLTTGMALSLPLILAGLAFFWTARRPRSP